MGQYLLIAFSVIVLSSFKFFFAPGVALLTYKLSFAESLIFTSMGGVGGLFLYAFLFDKLLRFWNNAKIKIRGKRYVPKNKPPKFKRLRQMITIKNRWGLLGIAVAIPVFSLPVCAFLVIRFFPRSKSLVVMTIALVVWAVILNTMYFFLGKSFFG